MIDNLLLISKLPTFILELFNSDEEIANNMVTLDDSLAHGIVYKILIENKLEQEGYESGILYFTKGSKLGENFYRDDDVDYTVLFGELISNEKNLLSLYHKAGDSTVMESKTKDTAVYYMRRKIPQKTMIKTGNERKNTH